MKVKMKATGTALYVGSGRRGCPKKSWQDCVKDDMESLCLLQRTHSLGIN